MSQTESPSPTSSLAIHADGLRKHYQIWNSPSSRLAYSFLGRLHKVLHGSVERDVPALQAMAKKRASLGQTFEALQDVSFTIRHGESVGIIGRNGSGKSTLLQIIAGTLRPTAGKVEVDGRVAAMLELGSGFNPEFTGRENVYLNATILGLTRAEIDDRIGAIVEFADLGLFIDQPVKTYSSGMVVRLGFAVLTQIEPEILIIDEALSVGDFLFQQKCFDFIRSFKNNGGTLLFVSHAMSTVLELCDRALLLDSGHLAHDGPAKDGIDLYAASALRSRFHTGTRPLQIVVPAQTPPSDSPDGHGDADEAASVSPPEPEPEKSLPAPPPVDSPAPVPRFNWGAAAVPVDQAGASLSDEKPAADVGSVTSDDASLQFVRLLGADGAERGWIFSEEEVTLEVGILCARLLHDPHVGFIIRDRLGRVIFETSTLCMRASIGAVAVGQLLVSRFNFDLPLANGEYSVTIGFANGAMANGGYEEALLFQHGVKIFQVYRNQSAITWSGVFNLRPTATFTKEDGTASEVAAAPGALEKSSHD